MPPTDALRQAMEESLIANPDDLATHMAYADHLAEQGDPRGEFIQVQLALEDLRNSEADRKRLQERERELLRLHQREWIGEAADLFLAQPETPVDAFNRLFGLDMYRMGQFQFRFHLGWLDSIALSAFSTKLAETLGPSPTIRFLRQLTIEHTSEDDNGLDALARWSALDRVRSFQIGPHDRCDVNGDGLLPVVAAMRRIEELYLYAHRIPSAEIFALPMPNLRKLHVYHVYDYPLDVLGNNPTLGNLVELSCWPHGLEPGDEGAYIRAGPFRELCFSPHLKSLTHLALYLTDLGDEGARAIVESGILKRLRVLDLNNGRITDAGARILASSPDIRHLQRLRITWNNLTPDGVAALRATGVNLEADGQYPADAIEEGAHLYEGDPE